jgi:hypothetical protein
MAKQRTQMQKPAPAVAPNPNARRATFADFAPQVYEFEIENEITGEVLVIEARSMDALERAQILLMNAEPKPPHSQIHRDGNEMLPEFDYYNLEYRREYEAWSRARDNRLIIHTITFPEIPGGSEDEKIDTLNTKLAPWVRDAFTKIYIMLSTVGGTAVKRRNFRPNRTNHLEPVQ